MSRVTPKWYQVNVNLPFELKKPLGLFAMDKNIAMSKLVSSLVKAVLEGDILVDELPLGNARMSGAYSVKNLDEMCDVTLRDKQGNILNPQIERR